MLCSCLTKFITTSSLLLGPRFNSYLVSLRSFRYCVGARLKFWRRSRVPNHGSLAGGISRGFAARDGSAVKSHSTILQRLRRQISLDYYTIPPATQAMLLPGRTCRTWTILWTARLLSKSDQGMVTPELMEAHNDDDVVDINCVALYYEKLRRQWECISSGRI